MTVTSSGGNSQVTQTNTATDPNTGAISTTTDTAIYSPSGQVLSDVVTDSNSNVLSSTVNTYDALGKKLSEVDGTGGNAVTTAWTYDAAGNITSKKVAGAVTTYGHDSSGNLTSVTDPVGNVTSFGYNPQGQVTSMTDPLGHTTYESYDANGQLASVTNRDGLKRTMLYTADGQIQTETWYAADGVTVVDTLGYTYYDATSDGGNAGIDGKLKTASNNQGMYTFTYNAQDQLQQVTEPFGVWLSFGYDAYGNRTSVTDSFGGTTTSIYNTANQLTSRSLSQAGATVLSVVLANYNAAGQVGQIAMRGPGSPASLAAMETYTYSPAGQITDLKETGPTGPTIAEYVQAYNSGAQLTSETTGGATQNYSYDGQGQLTTAGSKNYSYDANGNRTLAGYVIGPDNQVLSDGTYKYTYDAEGNESTKTSIASGDNWTYSYDNVNHLTQAVEKTSAARLS